MVPLLTTPQLSSSSEAYRAARVRLPHSKPFASPAANPGVPTRWSNMRSPPLGSPRRGRSPRYVPRHHSRPTHLLATRSPPPPGPRAHEPRHAPHPSPWAREEAREGERERLPRAPSSISFPGRLAAHPPRGSRRLLGAGSAPSYPENTPTTLAQGPEHPPSSRPPQAPPEGAAPPSHSSPRASAPTRMPTP